MSGNNQIISNCIIIGKGCQESFLPLQVHGSHPFQDYGVMLAGISTLQPAYVMGRASPTHHVLLCTVAGSAVLQTQYGEYRFRPGECVLLPAGMAHRYELTEGSWKILWLHLRDLPVWSAVKDRQGLLSVNWDIEGLERHMQGYIDEIISQESDAEQVAAAYATLVCSNVQRLIGALCPGIFQVCVDRRITRLWGEVNADIARNWDSEELAGRAHVSRGHLHRLCMQQYQMPPMQLLRKFRMERAASLIQYTNYTLDFVAQSVGYGNAFALSKAFKKYYHLSPDAFRLRK